MARIRLELLFMVLLRKPSSCVCSFDSAAGRMCKHERRCGAGTTLVHTSIGGLIPVFQPGLTELFSPSTILADDAPDFDEEMQATGPVTAPAGVLSVDTIRLDSHAWSPS